MMYYALQLGDHVLGGGFYATRLYRDVRQKAGYVYTIDNSLQAGETRANYSISYGCDPKNVSKARAMAEDELRDMQKNNVTPAELQQANALLLRQIPLGEASEDSVAGGLIGRARLGLPLDEPANACQALLRNDRPMKCARHSRSTSTRLVLFRWSGVLRHNMAHGRGTEGFRSGGQAAPKPLRRSPNS